MPEGPEIRRAADRLGKALIGKRLVETKLPYTTFLGREHLIEDQIVIDVTSQAKAPRTGGFIQTVHPLNLGRKHQRLWLPTLQIGALLRHCHEGYDHRIQTR